MQAIIWTAVSAIIVLAAGIMEVILVVKALGPLVTYFTAEKSEAKAAAGNRLLDLGIGVGVLGAIAAGLVLGPLRSALGF